MTKEEIISASIDTDYYAEIEMKIFGRKKEELIRHKYSGKPDVWQYPEYGGPRYFNIDWDSTWAIVDNLSEKGLKLVLFENQSGNEYHSYYAYFGPIHPLGQEPWYVKGEDAQEAICRAGLFAEIVDLGDILPIEVKNEMQ
jgi:hypothetical protein